MTVQSYSPGDVKIDVFLIDLNNQKNSILINDQISSIDIYESISGPLISGKITIVDSVNIKETFPIVKQKCKIYIKFGIPGKLSPQNIERGIELLVNEITNVNISENATYSIYELDLISIEIMNSSKTLQNVSMRGGRIDDYVRSIMEDRVRSKKEVYFEATGTKGIQHLDALNIKPFQAIDKIRRVAFSNKYRSSSYAFFENRIGFNFMPVEYLLERKNGKIKDAVFFFDSDVDTSISNLNYRNILSYIQVTQGSTTKLLEDGALNNVTRSVDLKTRSRNNVNVKLTDEFSQFAKIGGKRNSNVLDASFEMEFSKSATSTYNVIKNSSNPNNYLEEKIGRNKIFVSLLTQNIIRIMTWGDNALSAGMRIECHLPAPSGKTTQKGRSSTDVSKFISGEYLIWHIRHLITKDSLQKFRYFNSMELVNGSFGQATVPNE